MVLWVELGEPNAFTNNTTSDGHGVDESFCIFFNEFDSLGIAVSIRIGEVTLKWWVDAIEGSSPVAFDRGSSVTYLWECLQDRVERMAKLTSICSLKQKNVKDDLPEVGLKRLEESIIVSTGHRSNVGRGCHICLAIGKELGERMT